MAGRLLIARVCRRHRCGHGWLYQRSLHPGAIDGSAQVRAGVVCAVLGKDVGMRGQSLAGADGGDMSRIRHQRVVVNTPCWLMGHPSDSAGREISSTWQFTTANPYAVQVTFHVSSGPVTWLFARELLDDGCQATSGLADVRISPTQHPSYGRVIELHLSSPSGRALLLVNVSAISDFLRRTYELVPTGMESRHLQMDKWLTSLLSA